MVTLQTPARPRTVSSQEPQLTSVKSLLPCTVQPEPGDEDVDTPGSFIQPTQCYVKIQMVFQVLSLNTCHFLLKQQMAKMENGVEGGEGRGGQNSTHLFCVIKFQDTPLPSLCIAQQTQSCRQPRWDKTLLQGQVF